MKLVKSEIKDILDEEVTVSLTIKELISIRAVFGEILPSEFNKSMQEGKSDEFDKANMRELIDRICNSHIGIQSDIYDDASDVLAEVLEK